MTCSEQGEQGTSTATEFLFCLLGPSQAGNTLAFGCNFYTVYDLTVTVNF